MIADRDEQVIERARRRLNKRYLKVAGGWRTVAAECGLNWRWVWQFAVKGIVPRDGHKRRALGLPHILPSERKSLREKRQPTPKVWERPDLYFKKMGR